MPCRAVARFRKTGRSNRLITFIANLFPPSAREMPPRPAASDANNVAIDSEAQGFVGEIDICTCQLADVLSNALNKLRLLFWRVACLLFGVSICLIRSN